MTDKGPQCTAGYYCSAKSPEPTPVNETFGDICPAGMSNKYHSSYLYKNV